MLQKLRTILENKDDVRCQYCCQIRIPFELFDYLMPSARFEGGSFFSNICASKLSIFLNVDLAYISKVICYKR